MAIPKVLLVSNDQAESSSLASVLREHVSLHSAESLPEMSTELDNGSFDAVVCGWSFHKGTWNAALERVEGRTPDLPVVIFCRDGGERELAGVLEAGAFDFLVAPSLKSTALPVVQHAVVSYERRKLHRAARRRIYGDMNQPTPVFV